MSPTKVSYTVLRQARWSRWPRWASPPHSSLHGRSMRHITPPRRFNRTPAQHRNLSSTTPRHEQLAVLPRTTPKAPLSQAALEHISALKQLKSVPSRSRLENTNARERTSGSDLLLELYKHEDQVAARKPFYSLAKSSSDSAMGPAKSVTGEHPPLPTRTRHGIDNLQNGPALPPLRLSPSLGRSVTIEGAGGMDLARGLNLLKAKVSQNRIRDDSLRQRFHERPGLKRKRLKSQRWRKKFMTGFRAMVRQVQHMRRQGW